MLRLKGPRAATTAPPATIPAPSLRSQILAPRRSRSPPGRPPPGEGRTVKGGARSFARAQSAMPWAIAAARSRRWLACGEVRECGPLSVDQDQGQLWRRLLERHHRTRNRLSPAGAEHGLFRRRSFAPAVRADGALPLPVRAADARPLLHAVHHGEHLCHDRPADLADDHPILGDAVRHQFRDRRRDRPDHGVPVRDELGLLLPLRRRHLRRAAWRSRA